MSDTDAPSPELLLMLADLGPKDTKRASIKRCRKRVDRLRRNLAPKPDKVITLRNHEPARAKALSLLDRRCQICGHCIIRPEER